MSFLLTSDKNGAASADRDFGREGARRKRVRGQPTIYCEALRAAICRDIEAGVPVTKAFICNGISSRTGFNWANRRPEFARALAAARVRYQRQSFPARVAG